MDLEKRELMIKMKNGDDQAFDEVYRSYSGKLYRMALFITGNRNDSEDVLQETFVKCYLHRGELKDPERFESWIYQILVRTAWKMEKKKKNTGEVSFEEMLETDEGRSSSLGQRLSADDSMGPLESVLQKEVSREICDAVNRLDIRYRTVILLYYYNGLGIREISQVTGVFQGTVKSRLNKARKLLRESLDHHEEDSRKGLKEAVL